MTSESTTSVVVNVGDTATGCGQDAVDDPGLAADLGRPPAGDDGRLREEDGDDKQPQHPARLEDLALPEIQQGAQQTDRDEERRPESNMQ